MLRVGVILGLKSTAERDPKGGEYGGFKCINDKITHLSMMANWVCCWKMN